MEVSADSGPLLQRQQARADKERVDLMEKVARMVCVQETSPYVSADYQVCLSVFRLRDKMEETAEMAARVGRGEPAKKDALATRVHLVVIAVATMEALVGEGGTEAMAA
jgi:hypothetical protein